MLTGRASNAWERVPLERNLAGLGNATGEGNACRTGGERVQDRGTCTGQGEPTEQGDQHHRGTSTTGERVQDRGAEPIEGGHSTQAEGSAQAAMGVSAKTGWRLASFMNSSTGESFFATKKSLVAPANCR